MASFTRKQNGVVRQANDINELQIAVEQISANAKSPLYGALGDGTTDDSAAIEAAIAAVATAGGGVVLLPIGTYLLSANPVKMRSGVTLLGCGYDTVLKIADSVYKHVITNNSTGISNWRVCNLRINGNKSQHTPGVNPDLRAFGISMNNVGRGEIDHCWIHDTTNGGIYIDGGEVHVHHCRLDDIGKAGTGNDIIGRSGIVFDPATATLKTGNEASYNILHNILEHGVKFYPDNQYIVCTFNQVYHGGVAGDDSAFPIYCQGADNALIEGNIVIGNAAEFEIGINVGDGTYPAEDARVGLNLVVGARSHGMYIKSITGAKLYGNEITDCNGVGLRLESLVGGTVVGGRIEHNGLGGGGAPGIQLIGNDHLTITAVEIKNNGNASSGYGIWHWGAQLGSTNVVITACQIYDDQATKRQNYAIKSEVGSGAGSSSDYWTVGLCNLRGNILTAGAQLVLNGSNNITANNQTAA